MFLKIIKYRFLSSIKHPAVLICLIGAMVCSACVGAYSDNKKDEISRYPIAIVDEDGGKFAGIFIANMNNNSQLHIETMDRSRAISKVSTGKIDGAFILLDGFSEKIANGEIENLIEFFSPSVTTSAFPASEIVSAGVVDMWLMQLRENKIEELYQGYDAAPQVSLAEIKQKINTDYSTKDILTIEYIGDFEIQEQKTKTLPIDRAVGVFASFIIFAIMLSSEWIFNFKNSALQDRFSSNNSSMLSFFLGTQTASVLICMVFFMPVITFLSIYLNQNIIDSIYIFIGMLVYSLGICAMTFIVSVLVKNLTELIVLGVSIGISNILLSSLVTENISNSISVNVISKVLPGTYLIGCNEEPVQLLFMLLVAFVWVAIGYVITIKKGTNALR
ncbi:MAG: ABC transporter permease [Eubacteriales bacterium]